MIKTVDQNIRNNNNNKVRKCTSEASLKDAIKILTTALFFQQKHLSYELKSSDHEAAN